MKPAILLLTLWLSCGGSTGQGAKTIDLTSISTPPDTRAVHSFGSSFATHEKPLELPLVINLLRVDPEVPRAGQLIVYSVAIANRGLKPFPFPVTADWRLTQTNEGKLKPGGSEYLLKMDATSATGQQFATAGQLLYASKFAPNSFVLILPARSIIVRVRSRLYLPRDGRGMAQIAPGPLHLRATVVELRSPTSVTERYASSAGQLNLQLVPAGK